MLYRKFYEYMRTMSKLAKVLDADFYALVKDSISRIQDHPDLLYVKFLGLEQPERIPSDALISSLVKKEILRLTSIRETNALQDNIHALKMKNQCDILIGLLKDTLQE